MIPITSAIVGPQSPSIEKPIENSIPWLVAIICVLTSTFLTAKMPSQIQSLSQNKILFSAKPDGTGTNELRFVDALGERGVIPPFKKDPAPFDCRNRTSRPSSSTSACRAEELR